MSSRLLRSNPDSAKVVAETIEEIHRAKPTSRGGRGRRGIQGGLESRCVEIGEQEQNTALTESAGRGRGTGRRGRPSGRGRGGFRNVAAHSHTDQNDINHEATRDANELRDTPEPEPSHNVEISQSTATSASPQSKSSSSSGILQATTTSAATPTFQFRGMKALMGSLQQAIKDKTASESTSTGEIGPIPKVNAAVKKARPKQIILTEGEDIVTEEPGLSSPRRRALFKVSASRMLQELRPQQSSSGIGEHPSTSNRSRPSETLDHNQEKNITGSRAEAMSNQQEHVQSRGTGDSSGSGIEAEDHGNIISPSAICLDMSDGVSREYGNGLSVSKPNYSTATAGDTMTVDHIDTEDGHFTDDDGDATADNFSDGYREQARLREMRLEKGYPVDPIIEEQDEHDDIELADDVVPDDSDSTPRQKKQQKKKARLPILRGLDGSGGGAAEQAVSGEDVDQGGSGHAPGHAPGPFSDREKEDMDGARADFIIWLKRTAEVFNKSEESILDYMGFKEDHYRMPTLPNMYQSWYGAHNDKPADMSVQDWNKHVASEYHKQFEGLVGCDKYDKEKKKQAMLKVIQWYDKARAKTVKAMDKKGQTGTVMAKINKKLTDISQQAESHEIQVFGFSIYTGTNEHTIKKNAMWGGTKFEKLREKYGAVIRQQILDFETLFRNLDMIDRGLHIPMPRIHQKENDIGVDPKAAPRDQYRSYFSQFLRSDLTQIIRDRNDRAETDIAKLKLKSKAWPDQAFEEKVRIAGWPAEIRPVPGSDFDLRSLELGQLQQMVDPLIEHLERIKLRENSDESDESEMVQLGDKCDENLLRIEEWTEEEKSLSLQEQHSIDIVRGANGEKLRLLDESKSYKDAVAAQMKARNPEQNKRISRRKKRDAAEEVTHSLPEHNDGAADDDEQPQASSSRHRTGNSGGKQMSSYRKPPSVRHTTPVTPRLPVRREQSTVYSPPQPDHILPTKPLTIRETDSEIDGQNEEINHIRSAPLHQQYPTPLSLRSTVQNAGIRKRKLPDDDDNTTISSAESVQQNQYRIAGGGPSTSSRFERDMPYSRISHYDGATTLPVAGPSHSGRSVQAHEMNHHRSPNMYNHLAPISDVWQPNGMSYHPYAAGNGFGGHPPSHGFPQYPPYGQPYYGMGHNNQQAFGNAGFYNHQQPSYRGDFDDADTTTTKKARRF